MSAYIWFHATYVKVRRNRRIVSVAVNDPDERECIQRLILVALRSEPVAEARELLVAVDVNRDGRREVPEA